jgi:hypothetical protein
MKKYVINIIEKEPSWTKHGSTEITTPKNKLYSQDGEGGEGWETSSAESVKRLIIEAYEAGKNGDKIIFEEKYIEAKDND